MKKQDLKELKAGFMTTQDLLSRDIPNDLDYVKALNIYAKQQKIVSDEESRMFNEALQCKRFKEDLELKKKEQEFNQSRQAYSDVLENEKLKFEREKFEFEKQQFQFNLKSHNEEVKFKYISLMVSSLSALVSIIVPLVVYKKLAYANLKLIYRDEGRPTQDFRDAVKCIKSMTK